ncbi:hypothetical protein TorRG33x02_263020, partial [Trema orientale]
AGLGKSHLLACIPDGPATAIGGKTPCEGILFAASMLARAINVLMRHNMAVIRGVFDGRALLLSGASVRAMAT